MPATNRTGNPCGGQQGGTPSRGNLQVHFDLASTNDPTEGLPTLRAAEQRQYDKLSTAAKMVIMTQQPTGFRESTQSFAINMLSHSNRVNSRHANEAPFADSEASDTPYTPNNIKFKAKLEPGANLKDNEEAKEIVTNFKNNVQDAIAKLTVHSYELAKLETKQQMALRLKAFALGALELFHERIQNIIKDKPKPRRANTNDDATTLNLTVLMLSGISLVKFVWESLSTRYCEDYLGFMKKEVVDAIAKEISIDDEKQQQIFDCTDCPSLRPSTSVNREDYVPQYTLNAYEKFIESKVRTDVSLDKWFETITLDSQKQINKLHETKLENSRIIARRKARQKESATAATAAALASEPIADLKTITELVTKIQHDQEANKKEMMKRARKKYSGGLRPQAKPGNNNKHNGQSQKEASKGHSQKKKMIKQKQNDSGQAKKPKSKLKSTQGAQGKGRKRKRQHNPSGNNNAERNDKRKKKA
jgi:hypothetical protein